MILYGGESAFVEESQMNCNQFALVEALNSMVGQIDIHLIFDQLIADAQ